MSKNVMKISPEIRAYLRTIASIGGRARTVAKVAAARMNGRKRLIGRKKA